LNDRLLPAGRLREPLTSLARGDVIAFSPDLETQVTKSGERTIHWPIVNPTQRTWRTRRRTVLPESLPRRPIAFCGIARPHNFFGDIAAGSVPAEDKVIFPDHHSYRQRDIERLLELRHSKAADGFITTEKDAINLGSLAAALEPLAIASVELELEDADR